MSECVRCGQCCTYAYIWLGHIEVDNDPNDFGKWLSYHHCDIKRMQTEGQPDTLGVRVPLVCKFLDHNAGIATCRIYEKRPNICREYVCERTS
jgi:Fe-S-cluster containining protein